MLWTNWMERTLGPREAPAPCPVPPRADAKPQETEAREEQRDIEDAA